MLRSCVLFGLLLSTWWGSVEAQSIDLPPRPLTSADASVIIEEVAELSFQDRERRLVEEVLAGNVPSFLRDFVEIEMRGLVDGLERVVLIRVLPDVLSVGSSDDFFRVPLSPGAAQFIADRTNTSLPTPKISDAIWSASALRLVPQPIPPSEVMTTIPVFRDHHWLIESLWPDGLSRGTLVAGIKKDVVLSPLLECEAGRVAIYGWHQQDGSPIQPLYIGHASGWVDYSHGIRLISRRVLVDGVENDLRDVLEHPAMWPLVSDEGVMRDGRYPTATR